FKPKDAPRYMSTDAMMICCALCVVDLIFIACWYRRENRRSEGIGAAMDTSRFLTETRGRLLSLFSCNFLTSEHMTGECVV
ncbi:hypothetical protein BGZ57DRAFT_771204, partial [Hyaloscypha finlandica]